MEKSSILPCPFCGEDPEVSNFMISCCAIMAAPQICDILEAKGLRWHPDYEWTEERGYPKISEEMATKELVENWNKRA